MLQQQLDFQVENLTIGSVILNDSAVTNLDYSRDGKYLVSTTKDSSIHLIDCMTGMEKKKLYAKTHGIGHMKFTHHDSCILLTSAQKNSDIRYLCMYDNRYLKMFRHQDEVVTSLAMNPIDDCFLSASSSTG